MLGRLTFASIVTSLALGVVAVDSGTLRPARPGGRP
jgi:hypothetical protein